MGKSHVGMDICPICGKPSGIVMDKGLIDSLPREGVFTGTPCNECKSNMKKGIIIIEVAGEERKRTGHIWIVKEAIIRDMVNEPKLIDEILKRRIVEVEAEACNMIGLHDAQVAETADGNYDYDYEKNYFLNVLPDCDLLGISERKLVKDIWDDVKDKRQEGKELNIPFPDGIDFSYYSTNRLAFMSRCIYFSTHHYPGYKAPHAFNIEGFIGWKVANVLDQELTRRFELPPRVKIFEGKFRATLSGRDFWIWTEFGLATDENLAKYTEVSEDLRTYRNFKENAQNLKEECADLWDVRPLGDKSKYLKMYQKFLRQKQVIEDEKDLRRI